MSMHVEVSQFLLELYRASREIPFRNFQGWCLTWLQQVIEFDSAWWGNASEVPLQMHRIHLHNCAPGIVEDYLPYIDDDLFRRRACAQPGVTLNTSDIYTREALDQTPIHQGFAIKHNVAWSIGTVVIDEISSLYELMTLWRHDRSRPFSEDERARKQTLMPHLVEAHRNARLLQLRPRSAAGDSQIWALCDERGYLQELSPRFASITQRIWPHWSGSLLPAPLIIAARAEQRLTTADYVFATQRIDQHRLISIQARTAFDKLAPRQMEVASLYAEGLTYQMIAARLGTSPATVRSQIAALFKKLGVSNKLELARRIQQSRGDVDPILS